MGKEDGSPPPEGVVKSKIFNTTKLPPGIPEGAVTYDGTSVMRYLEGRPHKGTNHWPYMERAPAQIIVEDTHPDQTSGADDS